MTAISSLPLVFSASASWRIRASTVGMVGRFLRALTSARNCCIACSSITTPSPPPRHALCRPCSAVSTGSIGGAGENLSAGSALEPPPKPPRDLEYELEVSPLDAQEGAVDGGPAALARLGLAQGVEGSARSADARPGTPPLPGPTAGRVGARG